MAGTIFAAFAGTCGRIESGPYFPDVSFSAAREMLRMLRIA
jgi:hypothetical protein